MQEKILSIDEKKKKVEQKKGEINMGTRYVCVDFFFFNKIYLRI